MLLHTPKWGLPPNAITGPIQDQDSEPVPTWWVLSVSISNLYLYCNRFPQEFTLSSYFYLSFCEDMKRQKVYSSLTPQHLLGRLTIKTHPTHSKKTNKKKTCRIPLCLVSKNNINKNHISDNMMRMSNVFK